MFKCLCGILFLLTLPIYGGTLVIEQKESGQIVHIKKNFFLYENTEHSIAYHRHRYLIKYAICYLNTRKKEIWILTLNRDNGEKIKGFIICEKQRLTLDAVKSKLSINNIMLINDLLKSINQIDIEKKKRKE